MDQQDIINALMDKHVEPKGVHQTILIHGSWGVGKSHAWQCFADRIKHKHNNVKTLTVSFFGHSDLEGLRNKMKSDFLFTKTKFGESPITHVINKAIGNSSLRSASAQASSKWLGISIDPISFVPLQFGSDYIVCFDDLERKSPNIQMRDILGLIEEVRQSSRVVIIADETKLQNNDGNSEYHTFKEKVIDRTYHLETQEHNSLVEIFNSIYPNFPYVDIAIDMFKSDGQNNLRILQKLADFLKDISKYVSPHEDFTRLCCAVIFESVTETGFTCNSFSKPAEMDGNDLYYRYLISDRLRSIGKHICSYYTTNNIDPDFIKNVLCQPATPRDDELLSVLQDAFHRNEDTVRAAIREFIEVIDNQHTDYFRNIERAIVLFFHSKNLNDYFSLGFDNPHMESAALETIQKMIDNTNPESLTSVSLLDMYFIQAPDVAKDLINEVERLISEKIYAHFSESFAQYLQHQQYQSCLAILQNHPSIFPQIIDDVFDILANQHCLRSDVFFIRQVRDLVLTKYRQDIIDKLLQLSNSASDVIIKNRIQIISQEIQVNLR